MGVVLNKIPMHFTRRNEMNFKITLLLLCSVTATIVSGCASRDYQASIDAKRMGKAKGEMWETYNACLSYVWTNPAYKDYWSKTIANATDTRQTELLALNEKMSKQYRETLPQVAADLAKCDIQAYNNAQRVDTTYSKAFANAMYEVMAVYKNAVDGQYKTYSQFNKPLLAAMTYKYKSMMNAEEALKQSVVAQLNKEIDAEENRRNAILMMYSASQSSNQQPKYNTPSPITTNCVKIGNVYNCTSN